ncbi:glycosyltransferase [Candidatus Methylopumilus universalis]|uniref:glycosyltransferase n=1 Tax=Candidatus Methylopumilus universalis TaxID=2588536 RepID=UPI003BEEC31A
MSVKVTVIAIIKFGKDLRFKYIEKIMIRIFIGYDPKEEVAFHVLSASIMRKTSTPVSITPISLDTLKSVFKRDRNPLQSTEFSFSRFLTPFLSDYQGWSIFMDCDMLVLDDITNLWNLRDEKYALMCVHHNHTPKEHLKFLNQPQTQYERKNWSSLMLLNNSKCKSLIPSYVETASGLDLHRFKWIKDDLIGEISPKWNHLVGYDEFKPVNEISNLHYTSGGPYFEEYRNCPYAEEWQKEYKLTIRPY